MLHVIQENIVNILQIESGLHNYCVHFNLKLNSYFFFVLFMLNYIMLSCRFSFSADNSYNYQYTPKLVLTDYAVKTVKNVK